MFVLLASGGLDSTLLMARYQDRIGLALGVDYGQRHVVELDYAQAAADHFQVSFKRVEVQPLPLVTDKEFAARNVILLTLAAAYARVNGFKQVLIGCNRSDADHFPDCRPYFLALMDQALRAAYEIGVSAPLQSMTKAQIVDEARARKLPPTWTCYQPTDGKPCGECHACKTLEV